MSNQSAGSAASPSTKPRILLISLDEQPWFDEMYSHLLAQLLPKADVARAKSSNGAIVQLVDPERKPQAVILTDPSCTQHRHSGLLACLVRYVRIDGGTLLCGCNFSSSLGFQEFAPFFAKFGLNWESGDYHRCTVGLNEHVRTLEKGALAPSYSQKAVFLKGVARDAALYLPVAGAHIESAVFPPSRVEDDLERAQTPITYSKVGNGWFGYIGDVNGEEESDAVVLAICGL